MKKKSIQTLKDKVLATPQTASIRGGGVHIEDLVVQ